jgi:hypothetical protein
MVATLQRVLESALALPPSERVKVVEALLSSLRDSDLGHGLAWVTDVEDRLAALESGRMSAFDAEEVFSLPSWTALEGTLPSISHYLPIRS